MRILALAALAALAAGCGRSSADADAAALDAAAMAAEFDEDAGDDAEDSAAADGNGLALQTGAAPDRRMSGGASSGNYVRLTPAVIVDAVGFAQPAAAASLFVPHGWRQEGGVVWGQDYMCTNGYNFDWRAIAPDGSSGVMIIPQYKWENNSYGAAASSPGCTSAPFKSARDYLTAIAPRVFNGARVIDYRDRPDVLREQKVSPTRTPMAMGEIRTWAEAGEVLVAFQSNGRDMRASIAAMVQFQQMITDTSGMTANDPAAMMGIPQTGSSRMEATTGFANAGWAAFAPNGSFNFNFFEGIRRSIEPNAQWSKAIVNHNVKIAQVSIEESRKRAQMAMETSDYISRLQQETWKARDASAERQAREFGELMKGVETYRDADAPGGTVELDHRYNNAWRLNDGSYVISDDPNFDPWRDLRLEGRKLEAVQ